MMYKKKIQEYLDSRLDGLYADYEKGFMAFVKATLARTDMPEEEKESHTAELLARCPENFAELFERFYADFEGMVGRSLERAQRGMVPPNEGSPKTTWTFNLNKDK